MARRMDAAGYDMKKDFARTRWVREGYIADAGWFGPEYRARFGWLYTPEGVSNPIGVVIVPPFGNDETCAHRTLRHLAEASARSGFLSLRFDLDGCGDSAGDESDPDRVESWIVSVHDACDCMRRAGAASLVLVGIRLGATLAALTAQRRDDVAALVAFNPVVHGHRWLRELRAFQNAMNLQQPQTTGENGGQATSGFWLNPAACETLTRIDLTRIAAPTARVLLLDRDDLPGAADWHRHLQTEGCQVEQRRIPGYVEMMIDPHLNQVAQVFIDACIDYVRGMARHERIEPATHVLPLRPFEMLRISDTWIEEAAVSPGDGIFGILARPANSHPDRVLLILNAGAVHHIGVSRFDVGFSRRMAASGMQVLRVDLTGIGDSPARAGAIENATYGPDGVKDIGVCVSWLRARGARELIIGGMCSGASHALRAALAGLAIDAAYLINCGVFLARPGFDFGTDRRFNDIAHYSKSVKSARSWRKLLSGHVDLRRIAVVAAWKIALEGQGAIRNGARRIGMPLRGDLGRGFATLARRGVKIHFLYSDNDPGLIRLAVEAGPLVPKYVRAGHFSMRTFEGANHTFTQRWAQAALLLALQQIIKASATGSMPSASPQLSHAQH
ncbi:MAG: alpha/beta hydrolase [Pseudomonadota bacterium]